jgi:hypothetical protein
MICIGILDSLAKMYSITNNAHLTGQSNICQHLKTHLKTGHQKCFIELNLSAKLEMP